MVIFNWRISVFTLFTLYSLLFTVFIGCNGKSEEPTPISSTPFSEHELSARFPYDLGPATVDVSNYPKEIQQDYKLFLAVCGSCHTSARPLNAPYIKALDWKRYVHRMHIKMQGRGISLDHGMEKKIIEFLVYDSKVRKVDGKKQFQAKQKELAKLFEEVVKEQDRLILEETLKKPKKETPYVGVK